jgi:hypothetical protein
VAAAARCGERPDRVGLQSELDGTLREVERSRPKVVVDVSRIATSLLAGPRTNVQFFEALQKRLVAQGLRTVSFFMPVPAAAAGYAGRTSRSSTRTRCWRKNRHGTRASRA